ncbi:PspC domain-containing protein [Corynebacterium sp. CCM 9185]|uniref:PspC domain-containing protein n=1 Tax=Corynebacterium marambiense TaxID=2765364 RepID=A0ABS0VXW3_9CORY|nr:PspC domain-containing protein [Corynebacterium marambiense]MBI9000177.1 PspC domain-containing protein [Corynebacterium marambiense]MCK7663531.1 PspC domain-containing protein [Corynebacterium marambiense]MCX7542036.1 PspC domain-containing protein [Corynebacterium marambiense]
MEYGHTDSGPRTGDGAPLLKRKLRRSATDRMVAGVLGGIGETYGINSTLLRILFVASFLLPGPQMLFYFVMWFIMPSPEA